MLDGLFSNPKTVARCRSSWLREVIERYLDDLAAQEYRRGTLRVRAFCLLSFGEFTAGQGIQEVAQLPESIDSFIAQIPAQARHRHSSRLMILHFIRYLQKAKVLPEPEPVAPPPPGSLAGLFEGYLQYCRQHQGLRPGTIELSQRTGKFLVAFLATEGILDVTGIKPDLIHRFLKLRGKRCGRSALQTTCSTLRGFLGYLYRREIIGIDLRPAVIGPRIYKHEQCPRYLTRSEVDAVLAAIDRRTAQGRRDYAMVMLLAVYGLRGIEVIRLRFQDIDWRKQLLQIEQRKAGNCTTYPLSALVADAIVAYLQQGRPTSRHRDVFLTMSAPYRPLATGDCLGNLVKKYLTIAGVRVAHPGTHSFRYSCAQRLFDHGMPLKSIGDYLGHRDPSTTQRYTKIALDQLREVATGDGEELL